MPEDESNVDCARFDQLSQQNAMDAFMLKTIYTINDSLNEMMRPVDWCIDKVKGIPLTLYHIAVLPFSDDLKEGRIREVLNHELLVGRISEEQYGRFIEALGRDETKRFINDTIIPFDVGLGINIITFPLVPALTWLVSNDVATTLQVSFLANTFVISLPGLFRFGYSTYRTFYEINALQKLGALNRKHEFILAVLTSFSGVKAFGYIFTPWLSIPRNRITKNREIVEMAQVTTNHYIAKTCNKLLGRLLMMREIISFSAANSKLLHRQFAPLISTDFQMIES